MGAGFIEIFPKFFRNFFRVKNTENHKYVKRTAEMA